jgi:hypothetical protein
VADDVSKGEYENLLVREIELRQGTLEVEDAHIAAVCFTPAARSFQPENSILHVCPWRSAVRLKAHCLSSMIAITWSDGIPGTFFSRIVFVKFGDGLLNVVERPAEGLHDFACDFRLGLMRFPRSGTRSSEEPDPLVSSACLFARRAN